MAARLKLGGFGFQKQAKSALLVRGCARWVSTGARDGPRIPP